MLLLFFTTSCTKSLRDQEDFGKYLFDNLINKRTDKVKALYFSLKDTNEVIDKNLISFQLFIKFQGSEKKEEYIKRQNDQISAWYEKAQKNGISAANTIFVGTKYDSIVFIGDKYIHFLKIIFTYNNSENYFKLFQMIKLKDGWRMLNLFEPTNKEEFQKQIYVPVELKFSYFNWHYKLKSGATSCTEFASFFATISNQTKDNFDHIKFRIKIINTLNGHELFSKTYEKFEKIYSGDIVRYEIPELENYFLGVNVMKTENFNCIGEILDAKPKPLSQLDEVLY